MFPPIYATDPCLSDVPVDATQEELEILIAKEQGRAVNIKLQRFQGDAIGQYSTKDSRSITSGQEAQKV